MGCLRVKAGERFVVSTAGNSKFLCRGKSRVEAVFFLLRAESSRVSFKITVPSLAASYGSLPKVKLEKVFPFVRRCFRGQYQSHGLAVFRMPKRLGIYTVSESSPEVGALLKAANRTSERPIGCCFVRNRLGFRFLDDPDRVTIASIARNDTLNLNHESSQ